MRSFEAHAFGIPYPLTPGWLQRHGSAIITDYMREKISSAYGKKAEKLKKKGKPPMRYSQQSAEAFESKSGPVIRVDVKISQHVPRASFTPPKQYSHVNVLAPEFLTSFAWRSVRMQALKVHGAICMCCGDTPKNGAIINVDHIKPRKLFPELALELSNLQILCSACNHGKGNWDQTDWRDENPASQEGLDGYSQAEISKFLSSI